MKSAIGFLLLCMSTFALSPQVLSKGHASGPLAGPQDKQRLVHASSSVQNPGAESRLLGIRTQGYNPWVEHVSGVPSGYWVSALHVVDSNTTWAVCQADVGSSQIYTRTTNGGTTWICDTVHVAPATYSCTGVYAFTADRAWVTMNDDGPSSGGGIFRTTDGGMTWNQDTAAFKTAGGWADFIHFFDANNGVCVGDPTNGYFEIYATSNAGESWSRVPQANIPAPLSGEYAFRGEFTAAGNSLWFPGMKVGTGRVFGTTDKGLTWSVSVIPNVPSGFWPTVEFQDESIGLAIPSFGSAEKTTDGGATWTTIPTLPGLNIAHIEYVPHTPAMYVATVWWSCKSLVQQPYIYGTMYTVDGGIHWTWASTTTVTSTWTDLNFSSPTSGWRGDPGQSIFKWTLPTGRIVGVHPDSLIFSPLEGGLTSDTISVDFVNHGTDSIVLSSISMPGAEYTVVKQPTLPMVLPSLGSARVELCFTPRTNGVHRDSLVFVSDASNAPEASMVLEGKGLVVQPALDGVVYGASSSLYRLNLSTGVSTPIGSLGQVALHGMTIHPSTGILYGTSAGGTTTTVYRVSCEDAFRAAERLFRVGEMRAIAFDLNGDLYGASRPGRLYRLNLATGDTVGIGTAPGVAYGSIAFSPSGRLWASVIPSTSGKDRIYIINKTTGEATLVGNTGDSTYTPSIFFDPNGHLYGLKGVSAQTNKVISIDTLTGAGSELFSMGMSGITALTMASFGGTVSVESQEIVPRVFGLGQNYPNPFNPKTVVSCQLPVVSNARLVVYDMLGREVKVLMDEKKEPGDYSVEFDATGLASGVYFYRMTAGSFVSTKRMLLVK